MTLSVARTPSIVFSRIGQTAPETMTTIFMVSVMPEQEHHHRDQHRRRDGPEELQQRFEEFAQPAGSGR